MSSTAGFADGRLTIQEVTRLYPFIAAEMQVQNFDATYLLHLKLCAAPSTSVSSTEAGFDIGSAHERRPASAAADRLHDQHHVAVAEQRRRVPR
ncbi:hypothetical protein, partial [Solimonas soli]|uniref:hypothetical protein n=1 Tax=Solimonas soli TaxID=413479 RepID=UPI001B7FC0EA